MAVIGNESHSGLGEPYDDGVPGDPLDHVDVAADHKQVAGPGETDVQHFLRPRLVTEPVDRQHDCRALQSFEAEDVSVEGHTRPPRMSASTPPVPRSAARPGRGVGCR